MGRKWVCVNTYLVFRGENSVYTHFSGVESQYILIFPGGKLSIHRHTTYIYTFGPVWHAPVRGPYSATCRTLTEPERTLNMTIQQETDVGLGGMQHELLNGNWWPYWSFFISSVSQNAIACWFGLRGIFLLIQPPVHDDWPWTCNMSNTKNLHILIL